MFFFLVFSVVLFVTPMQNQTWIEELSYLNFFCSFVCLSCFSVHKRFSELDPEAVSRNRNALLPKEKILELQELRVNIFLFCEFPHFLCMSS